jgi:hypothetical protein
VPSALIHPSRRHPRSTPCAVASQHTFAHTRRRLRPSSRNCGGRPPRSAPPKSRLPPVIEGQLVARRHRQLYNLALQTRRIFLGRAPVASVVRVSALCTPINAPQYRMCVYASGTRHLRVSLEKRMRKIVQTSHVSRSYRGNLLRTRARGAVHGHGRRETRRAGSGHASIKVRVAQMLRFEMASEMLGSTSMRASAKACT